jgi:hypothetical protein
MEMTGRQVMAASAALRTLGSKPIRVAGAVKVAKALHEMQITTEIIEKRRWALLQDYALVGEDGKLVQNEQGHAVFPGVTERDAFGAAYNALIDEPVYLGSVQVIKVQDLGEIEIAPDALAPLVAAGLIE